MDILLLVVWIGQSFALCATLPTNLTENEHCVLPDYSEPASRHSSALVGSPATGKVVW